MELERKRFYRFIAPRPTVMVTTVDKEKNINVAPFSFVTPISIDPPLLAIALGHAGHTLKNIRDTREFIVNIPTEKILNELWMCSKSHPLSKNELEDVGLMTVPSKKLLAPLIGECVAWFECLLEYEKKFGDHVLVIGEVVNAIVRDEIVGKDGGINLKKAKILMHISGPKFTIARTEITPSGKNKDKM